MIIANLPKRHTYIARNYHTCYLFFGGLSPVNSNIFPDVHCDVCKYSPLAMNRLKWHYLWVGVCLITAKLLVLETNGKCNRTKSRRRLCAAKRSGVGQGRWRSDFGKCQCGAVRTPRRLQTVVGEVGRAKISKCARCLLVPLSRTGHGRFNTKRPLPVAIALRPSGQVDSE